MTVSELNRGHLHVLKQAYCSELVNKGTFAEVMGVDIDEPSYEMITNIDGYISSDNSEEFMKQDCRNGDVEIMKEFKEFVLGKCKEVGISDTENIYFSQTRDMYYADYKPNYPEKTNGDFTISQEIISGTRKMYGNFNALIPTIVEL